MVGTRDPLSENRAWKSMDWYVREGHETRCSPRGSGTSALTDIEKAHDRDALSPDDIGDERVR